MNIAITGAAGYIGKKIVEQLENNDKIKKIVGISRRKFTHSFKKLEYHQMDVRSDKLYDLFHKHNIDVIIHLAFIINPLHNESEMHNIDVAGTKNVLNIAKKLGVKKIIITSSTMVYGAWPDNPEFLTETDTLRGHNHYYYNIDKVKIEGICNKFKEDNPDISLNILRPCLVIGPTVDHFYSRMLNWPFLPLVNGQNPALQFIHENDLAYAYELFVLNGEEGVFNLVGPGVISWKEIIETAGKRAIKLPQFIVRPMLRLLWKLHLTEVPPDVLDFVTYPWVATGEKAAKKLGFTPKYSSKEAYIDFLKAQKHQ